MSNMQPYLYWLSVVLSSFSHIQIFTPNFTAQIVFALHFVDPKSAPPISKNRARESSLVYHCIYIENSSLQTECNSISAASCAVVQQCEYKHVPLPAALCVLIS
jgi:hypothetical protein